MNDQNELEKKIIDTYQQEEAMMILIFAQWCVNNEIDPFSFYQSVYPDQVNNPELQRALDLTVSKDEAEPIDTNTVCQVLQYFGNEELAYAVAQSKK
ncbi:hypothetical protein JCM19046_3950 [Bacillus sp. JCM 19046]|uniref:Uncharacterized protein n=1 Tax=Shouchella xiaoxiensis TaxID=766895 RepID=A0ABS2SZR0_9BACI|nr:hypothetical protein [Shouchella xiaoxiensis]MBM7841003.1 hypothetical protein [Shouchella xiaoxiensis]GAF14132.1 hypothetical protein JCM19045_3423 [Bacillus sp. JCM 19045]GAF19308.1 hypothetical protein JCM19046_3950 [Bacillus sp. JCM 19046]